MLHILYGYSLSKVSPDKYRSLTVPVSFGPMDYIAFASVTFHHFYIVSLVEAK